MARCSFDSLKGERSVFCVNKRLNLSLNSKLSKFVQGSPYCFVNKKSCSRTEKTTLQFHALSQLLLKVLRK